MEIRYLSSKEVLLIHDHAIGEFGGSFGLMSPGQLEASIAVPCQTMFGEELYPDLFSKAIAAVRELADEVGLVCE